MPDIYIERRDSRWPESVCALIEKAILKTIGLIMPEIQKYEVSAVLGDNSFVQELNMIFRGKDKPTNVLSFPSNENSLMESLQNFGDIAMAYETILQESQEQGKSFEDHAVHLVVHGTLHLLSYDHMSDEEASIMEAEEIKILSELGIENPYI